MRENLPMELVFTKFKNLLTWAELLYLSEKLLVGLFCLF